MELNSIRKAYFIGVGGIGVSAVLRFLYARGVAVSGSDIALPPNGVLPEGTYHEGALADHVPHDTNVIIYSPAVPPEHIERQTAKELGIPQLSYPEALALVTKEHTTIAVSGTHGKSTTTALMGMLFIDGGFDPSVIVGAEVPEWKDRNLHMGKHDIFIVEACEYRRHMLNLHPQTIVLTNLELDHPDYYVDLADIKNAFREYVTKLSGEDLLIVNGDDANIRDIMSDFDGIIVRFGIGEGADLYARNIKQQGERQTFELVWKGTPLGAFSTPLSGIYNIYNILAATSAYLSYGGQIESVQSTLDRFIGVGRRFEVIGNLGKAIVISDYAHHPTALRAVAEAAQTRYKHKEILVVFRPHHRERTLKLLDQFVDTISSLPHVVLVEIYDVAGREEGMTISSKDVIDRVCEKNPNADCIFSKDLDEAEKLIRAKADQFDVILVVGAGDADILAKRLI